VFESRNRRIRVLSLMSRIATSGAWEEFPDSFVHFPRGLIREGHTQNVSRRHTTFGQVSDTVSDHASFAGSGSSQYQNRAADCFHSLSLLRIQRAQIQHRARSVAKLEIKPQSPKSKPQTKSSFFLLPEWKKGDSILSCCRSICSALQRFLPKARARRKTLQAARPLLSGVKEVNLNKPSLKFVFIRNL